MCICIIYNIKHTYMCVYIYDTYAYNIYIYIYIYIVDQAQAEGEEAEDAPETLIVKRIVQGGEVETSLITVMLVVVLLSLVLVVLLVLLSLARWRPRCSSGTACTPRHTIRFIVLCIWIPNSQNI